MTSLPLGCVAKPYATGESNRWREDKLTGTTGKREPADSSAPQAIARSIPQASFPGRVNLRDLQRRSASRAATRVGLVTGAATFRRRMFSNSTTREKAMAKYT